MTVLTHIESFNRIVELLKAHKSLAVWSSGSPDPDFLACAEVMRRLGASVSCRVKILGASPISLDVNRKMIRDFSIPYKVAGASDFVDVEGLVIIDFARVVKPPQADNLPVLLHVDHHHPVPDETSGILRIIDTEIGAVATLFSEMLQESRSEPFLEILRACATPLYYAILVDTDQLVHASERDQMAGRSLKKWLNEPWLSSQLKVQLTESQKNRLQKGIDRSITEDKVMLCGLGVIPVTERDLIAISADMLIKTKGVDLVAVYALIRSRKHLIIDVSLRSRNRETPLLPLIQQITHEGGARPFKGAFQINMDYFLFMADSEELWHLVEESTRHQILTAFRQSGDKGRWSPLTNWLRRLGHFFDSD